MTIFGEERGENPDGKWEKKRRCRLILKSEKRHRREAESHSETRTQAVQRGAAQPAARVSKLASARVSFSQD